jgi:hypothetical protein
MRQLSANIVAAISIFATAGRVALTNPTRGRICGLAGAALLAVGVFTPIVRVPIVGSINYFRNGTGDGTVILVISALAALFAAVRQTGWLLPLGTFASGLLAIVFLSLRARMTDVQSSMVRDLADNPFRGIAEAMTQSIQLEWGWAVMVAGGLLLLVVAMCSRTVWAGCGARGSTRGSFTPTSSPFAAAPARCRVST